MTRDWGPSPPSPASAGGTWAEAASRRTKRASHATDAPSTDPSSSSGAPPREDVKERERSAPNKGSKKKPRKRKKKRAPRPPGTAAVKLSVREGGKHSLASLFREVQSKVDIRGLGIARSRIRNTLAGDVLIEILGKDRNTKADQLQQRMTEALG